MASTYSCNPLGLQANSAYSRGFSCASLKQINDGCKHVVIVDLLFLDFINLKFSGSFLRFWKTIRRARIHEQVAKADCECPLYGTIVGDAERFYRRTLDKLELKLLESGVFHTVPFWKGRA